MSVAQHVDQQNEAEQFWLKPQVAMNVLETRFRIVPSKNVQKIVNGVPGVSVVLHVDQQNEAEQFWLKP